MISDIHITDYSGSFLDFILLDKPVIHYIYDYEYYRDIDTGLYYPIEEYAAGFYSKESTEVIDEIERLLKHNDRFVERRHKIRNVFLNMKMAQRQREYAIRYYIAIKVVCLSAFPAF